MGLEEDDRVGVRLTRRLQQGKVRRDLARAAPDGGVILHLPRNEDAVAHRKLRQRAALVVFRKPERDQPPDQPLCAGGLIGTQRGTFANQPLQPAFAGGVVVDAQIVKNQRQRRHQFCAQPAGAQEAVLDPDDIADLASLRGPAHPAPRRGGAVREDDLALASEEGLDHRPLP